MLTRRKRSLCFDVIVSPSVDLADNLQDLTTSSRNSWQSKDINRARRKLSLPSTVGTQQASFSNKRKPSKESIDDGCFVESPASSSDSSPISNSNRHHVMAQGENVLFSRFKTDLDVKSGPISILMFPDACQSTFSVGGKNSDENKENELLPSTSDKVTVNKIHSLDACFKSPLATPKLKKGVFKTHIDETAVSVSRCASFFAARKSFRKQESIDDDGFIQQYTGLEDTPRKLDLPQNFEKLLFSPLIECQEHDATPLKIADSDHSDSSKSFSLPSPFFSLSESSSYVISGPSVVESGSQENWRDSMIGTKAITKKKTSKCMKSNVSMTCFQRQSVLRSESVDEQKLCIKQDNIKRKRRNELQDGQPTSFPMLIKCHSEAELCIKSALNLDEIQQDLIGDFSRKYSLPLIRGKHQDLKTISTSTMASLLRNDYASMVNSFTIIDCRYPYEFEGGHIRGAINVHSTSDIMSEFFPNSYNCRPFCLLGNVASGELSYKRERNIVIFHCEFSSERGPKLSRFMRKTDREKNANSYPFLYYPELYLLEGGYKAFFEVHPELCEPNGYVPMLDPKYSSDLRYFRNRSCSMVTGKSLSKFLFSDQ